MRHQIFTKTVALSLVIFLLILNLIVILSRPTQAAGKMQYKVVESGLIPEEVQVILNDQTAARWEFVESYAIPRSNGSIRQGLIFKK